MTTKHEVIALHKEHPDWTSGQIAWRLGCMAEYVSVTFRRNGLKLPNSRPGLGTPQARLTERERCAIIAERMGSPEIAEAIRGRRAG